MFVHWVTRYESSFVFCYNTRLKYCCFTDIDAMKRHPRRTIMGSPATKLAAETELAETMRETTGVGGRSVDWTLPAADKGASPMAASSAPRPDENAISDRKKSASHSANNRKYCWVLQWTDVTACRWHRHVSLFTLSFSWQYHEDIHRQHSYQLSFTNHNYIQVVEIIDS